jgi:hypothetical protein
MARPAYESPNHVASLSRWVKQARAENPHLDNDQVMRQAQRLKSEYYSALSLAGVRARRIRAEIDRIEDGGGGG